MSDCTRKKLVTLTHDTVENAVVSKYPRLGHPHEGGRKKPVVLAEKPASSANVPQQAMENSHGGTDMSVKKASTKQGRPKSVGSYLLLL